MYKIYLNKSLWPFILFILTIAMGIFAEKLNLITISMPVWMLFGFVALFLIASVSLYSKGTIKHFLMICGIMVAIFALSELLIISISIGLGIKILEALILKISLIALTLPIFMSVVITKLAINLEEIHTEKNTVDSINPLENKEEDASNEQITENVIESIPNPATLTEETKVEIAESSTEQEKLLFNKPKSSNEDTKEIFFEDIMEEKPKTPQISDQIDSTKIETQPEVFFEDIMEPSPPPIKQEGVIKPPQATDLNTKEDQTTDINTKKIPEHTEKIEEPNQLDLNINREEDFVLQELPALDGELEELQNIKTEEQRTFEITDVSEPPAYEEEEFVTQSNYIEEIPEDHFIDTGPAYIPKLTETPRKIEDESGGKISSIGKLLVDKRDIENIIETHALMQHVGSENMGAKIISPVEGDKMTEKINTIKELGASHLVIVNEGGFIQTSNFDDKAKEQVLGAMASGTMGIIINSLRKMGFKTAKDITFESETGLLTLNKITANIYAIFFPPETILYDLKSMNEILVTASEREPDDLVSLMSSINGILGVVMANKDSELIISKLIDSTKNPENIAKILPAFYSNLGVFIKSMEQGALRKCIIGTGNETIIFTSLGTNILMLYATLNTCIKPQDIKIQYETIISS